MVPADELPVLEALVQCVRPLLSVAGARAVSRGVGKAEGEPASRAVVGMLGSGGGGERARPRRA